MQAVARGVDGLDRLVEGADRPHRDDRAEDLLVPRERSLGHVEQDGRLEDAVDDRTTVHEGRSRRDSRLDPVADPRRRALVDEGGNPGVGRARVADDDLTHPSRQRGEERLADHLDDEHALHADARLPRGVVPAADDRVGGRVEVGIIGDDEGRVRPELEKHLGRRGVARDLVTDGRRPGEGHGADPPVRRQRHSHVHSPRHELDGAARAPRGRQRLAHHVHEPERGERRLRCRLDDDRAAGRESRRQLVGGEKERVVVPGDPDDDPDRLAHPEAEQALTARQQVERHRLPVEAGHLLGSRGEREQRAVHLDAAVDERLARLEDEQ